MWTYYSYVDIFTVLCGHIYNYVDIFITMWTLLQLCGHYYDYADIFAIMCFCRNKVAIVFRLLTSSRRSGICYLGLANKQPVHSYDWTDRSRAYSGILVIMSVSKVRIYVFQIENDNAELGFSYLRRRKRSTNKEVKESSERLFTNATTARVRWVSFSFIPEKVEKVAWLRGLW